MSQVFLPSMWGEITLEQGGQLVCRLSGGIVDVLLAGAVLLLSLGLIALVALITSSGAGWEALLGLVPVLLMVGYFAALLRLRRRRMGMVVIDRARGVLVRSRGGRELERWPLDQIRFGSVWDPFHRDFGRFFWLTARVPDGRRLRLAKGPEAGVRQTAQWLEGQGLRLE